MSKRQRKRNPIRSLVLPLALIGIFLAALIVLIVALFQLKKNNEYLILANRELSGRAEEVQAAWDRERQETENDTSFDYLALGNSITRYPGYNGLWWGDWGMAASSEDKDYFHLVKSSIEMQYGESSSEALNIIAWELPYYDRTAALPYLRGYLNDRLDLVTVQVGENVHTQRENDPDKELSDAEFYMQFETDLEKLVEQIKAEAPNAKILILGNIWEDQSMDDAKQSVCQRQGAAYIPMNEIQGMEYKAKAGTVVEGADENIHEIAPSGVAEHPNDEGMKYIAEKICENIPGLLVE